MNRWVISIYFCLFGNFLMAQNTISYKGWDSETVQNANTAESADYLSEMEKQVVLLTNLARINGPHFAATFLEEWLKDKKSSGYSRSLVRELKKTNGLPLLYPMKDLYDIALGHAVKSGKKGTTGHQDFDKRFKPVLGPYKLVAENCAYGYEKAMDIVIGLLVDEGIRDLGHRKNMLNPELNSIGVSIQPHKRYTYNCVMDFGKR